MCLKKSLRCPLNDESIVNTSTVASSIGSEPGDLVQALDIDLIRGKIPTDRYLHVERHDNVWAVGDAALIELTVRIDHLARQNKWRKHSNGQPHSNIYNGILAGMFIQGGKRAIGELVSSYKI